MKLLFVSLLLIISETNSFYITNRTYKDENRILLRKLQNLQQNPNTAQTWSDIFADSLLKRIFSFHKTNNETENLTSVEPPETSVWIKAVSCILKFYKKYVYDKIAVKTTITTVYEKDVVTAEMNKDVEDTSEVDVADFIPNDVEMIEPKYHGKMSDNTTDDITILYKDIETNDIEVNITKVQKDVEIIEPKYHGEVTILNNDIITTETNDIEVTSEVDIGNAVELIDDDVIDIQDDCKNGLKKDPDGNCVDPKSLKFILSIPPQCPTGYRRDWLGYCRGAL